MAVGKPSVVGAIALVATGILSGFANIEQVAAIGTGLSNLLGGPLLANLAVSFAIISIGLLWYIVVSRLEHWKEEKAGRAGAEFDSIVDDMQIAIAPLHHNIGRKEGGLQATFARHISHDHEADSILRIYVGEWPGSAFYVAFVEMASRVDKKGRRQYVDAKIASDLFTIHAQLCAHLLGLFVTYVDKRWSDTPRPPDVQRHLNTVSVSAHAWLGPASKTAELQARIGAMIAKNVSRRGVRSK